MKKLTVLLILIAIMPICYAQQGRIIYTEYHPDWCLESKQYQPADSIKLDFDGDGVFDFAISMFYQRYIEVTQTPLNGWESRTWITQEVSDTLVSSAPWGWATGDGFVKATRTFGVRKVVNDTTVYYGWFNQEFIDATVYGENPIIKEYICVHDVAFCTIPNYPLRWGQNSLSWDAEEYQCNTCIMLKPNPTTGAAQITGKNIVKTEVINVFGQCVFSISGENDDFQIDLAGQPAGIYFVSITSQDGKRCVKKVIKQ